MCLTAKNFGLQEEDINISKPQERPLIRKTGWGTTERKRERHMDRKREKRVMQCYMKKEDNSLTDVENVVTTGERCRHLS